MKKIVLLVATVILGYASANAQIINIVRTDNHHLVNDSLITVYGNTSVGQYSIAFDVVNAGKVTTGIKARWEDSVMVPKTAEVMCWGSCFTPQQTVYWQAPTLQNLTAGDTNNTFVGYYNDSSQAGTEIVRYVFFNASLTTDSAWVLVKYVVTPLGVEQLSASALHISAPYPNPAGSSASFNYHITSAARLTIYNTIGQSVKEMWLNPTESRLNLNVSGMPSGIYICKLEASGTSAVFQKLVVTH